MITEHVVLDILPGQEESFEQAFQQASLIIAQADGFISLRLLRCQETKNRYLLLIKWETLLAHIDGFRNSNLYEQWRALLHHFYEQPPLVEHFDEVLHPKDFPRPRI